MTSIYQLNVVYNNVLRMLPKYCSASTMFVENCFPNSQAVIRKLVYKCMLTPDASDDKMVIAIVRSDLK